MNRGHKPVYERVAHALQLRPDDDFLEVACGNGYFLKKYAGHVHSIAGLDLSQLAIDLALKRNRERVRAGTAEFVRGEASKLPWEDRRFSAATAMASFPAFARPSESLQELYRVLRPGGRVVISIEWNAEDGRDHSKAYEKYGYRIWTSQEVRRMMETAGFGDVSITYAEAFMLPRMMLMRAVKSMT
jgi:ubiquinone/menaquinone biosynthesis C-methylase UbiE